MVSTFYDAIPFLFRKQFLTDEIYAKHYDRTLGLVRRSTRVLAISDAAAGDAVSVGVPAERIDRAYPMVDAVFRPMADRLVAKLLLTMEPAVRVPDRFLFTVTYPQYTKNLDTLLQAYAALPPALRREYPLVICCPLTDHARHVIGTVARETGITQDLVLTGTVTDLQLCALYNRAAALVYPSRYEGFGMPIVEAMTCGTPVITTTASSMPEAAGQAAILVDPEDPAAFTEAIAGLLMDPVAAADSMREAGFAQAGRFDAGQLARSTLASYQRAAGAPAEAVVRRPRIALWTPLPPLQTGIADYSAELLEALEERCDVEVFVDDGYLPDDTLVGRYTIQHSSAFGRRHAQVPFDSCVYQVGASLFHPYMAKAMQDHPGIAVLHDLVWSQVLHAYWHTRNDVPEFHRCFAASEGQAALEELLAIDPQDHGRVSEFLGRHPMLEPLVDPSLAQIVHHEVAAEELRAAHPGSDPCVIPMGVTDPYDGDATMSPLLARSALNRTPAGFLVGVYGIIHPYKRLESAIAGFAAFARERPDATLLVVGRCYDPGYQAGLEDLAAGLGVASQVEFTGRVFRNEFDAYLKAADVILNLRSPLTGSMSAVLMRAFAAGRPVVMSDRVEWRSLPSEACIRVPTDETEVADIAAALRRLGSDPVLRASMGAAARAHYEREGTIQRMAERYLDLIERTATSQRLGALPAPEPVAVG